MNRLLTLILLIPVVLALFFWKQQENDMENSSEALDPSCELSQEGLSHTQENDIADLAETQDVEIPNDAKKGHWETVIVTEPAWDERVLIKEAWTETVLVKDAWDEEDTYCSVYGQDSYSGYECNCGKVCGTLEEVMRHVEEDENCNSWHNKTIYFGDPYCQTYKTDYIHHDAEYKTIYHDAEYKTVHHEARTYEKQVWIEE